jgi:hypothetical protein
VSLDAAAVARRTWRWWQAADRWGLHELVVVVLAFLLYFFIRGAVVDREADAFANARELVDLERSLGMYWESGMQGWIVGSEPLIRLVNWVYFWGHMPVVVAFAAWLYFRQPRTYALVRNAFLASGAIAIVIYAAYPVAPPRLLPDAGFVDTMAIYDRVGYQTQESQAFVNPFAAMPSLHFGWALLLGLTVARVGRRPAWVLSGVAWPVAMFFSIVLTANHWIVDAIAGGIVSFAGLGVAVVIERRIWPAIHTRWEQLARGEPAGRPPQRLPERMNAATKGESEGG